MRESEETWSPAGHRTHLQGRGGKHIKTIAKGSLESNSVNATGQVH